MKPQPVFPYGVCECTDCGPLSECHGMGPAAYSVVRNGVPMNVCTRCDLTSDQSKRLLVTKQDQADIWMNYDPLGAFCIIGALMEEEEASDGR